MGFLEKLSEMIAPASKQFEQNVNKAPMGNPMPYHDGISAEDMYRLQMAKQAQEANIKAAYDKLNAAKDAEMLKNYQTSQSDMRDINTARGLGYDKNPVLDPTSPIGQRVDPGLAAKYIQMQEAYDRYK